MYNGERFIRAALDSLAAQTLRPDRVIVLDDASTDGTSQLVETYEPLDCELIRSEKTRGCSKISTKRSAMPPSAISCITSAPTTCCCRASWSWMTAALTDAPAPAFSYCLPEFIDKDGNQLDAKPSKPSAATYEVSANALLAQHSECDSLMLGGVLIKSLGQACPRCVPHRHAARG